MSDCLSDEEMLEIRIGLQLRIDYLLDIVDFYSGISRKDVSFEDWSEYQQCLERDNSSISVCMSTLEKVQSILAKMKEKNK